MNNRWYVLSTVLLVCLAMAACKPAPIVERAADRCADFAGLRQRQS